MKKEQFRLCFRQALDRAILSFVKVYGPIDKPNCFEVYAPDPKGKVITENEAIDAIFLNELLFYKVIDVGLIFRSNKVPIGFVRVSGHPPCPFEETLNPQDLGPFKSLEPLTSRY